MLVKVVNFFFLLGIAAIMSCGSTGSASKGGGSDRGDHYEDLSMYRPDYGVALDTMASKKDDKGPVTEVANVNPEFDVTNEVNQLLDSINLLKADIKYVDGYTIQVYTGIKREDANDAKTKVYTTLPDSRPVITYDQPNFKVKVGQFYSRREALRTFAELKRALPAAIIISEKIPVGSDD